jgi:hypothetical protein
MNCQTTNAKTNNPMLSVFFPFETRQQVTKNTPAVADEAHFHGKSQAEHLQHQANPPTENRRYI